MFLAGAVSSQRDTRHTVIPRICTERLGQEEHTNERIKLRDASCWEVDALQYTERNQLEPAKRKAKSYVLLARNVRVADLRC